jgi:proteasome assembly chaperone (PAC2) family protein
MTDAIKMIASSGAVVSAAAAMAVGFGWLPSASDLKRVEAQASQVSQIKVDVAVLMQRMETVEKTTARIESAQTIHFDKLMNKIERIQR